MIAIRAKLSLFCICFVKKCYIIKRCIYSSLVRFWSWGSAICWLSVMSSFEQYCDAWYGMQFVSSISSISNIIICSVRDEIFVVEATVVGLLLAYIWFSYYVPPPPAHCPPTLSISSYLSSIFMSADWELDLCCWTGGIYWKNAAY